MTTEAPATKDAPPTLRGVVASRAIRLQTTQQKGGSPAVAALARLRRAVGKDPGAVSDILEHTTHAVFVRGWSGDDPSRAEIAAHHAMTLFALHQQSQSRGMHQHGVRLGAAVRKLVAGAPQDSPVTRRFAMLSTADSPEELVHHLRGLVQLLRASAVPLDYGWLAQDLDQWQRGGDDRTRVRLAWGRTFHLGTGTPDTPGADSPPATA